jgi:uncharacterized membrane protein
VRSAAGGFGPNGRAASWPSPISFLVLLFIILSWTISLTDALPDPSQVLDKSLVLIFFQACGL